MNQSEQDKEDLRQAYRELGWKQDAVDRLENAVNNGRCKCCTTPLSDKGKEYCDDYPECDIRKA